MAAPLGLLLLYVPAMVVLAKRLLPREGAWPIFVPMILLLGLIGLMLRGVYRNNRDGLTVLAWAYASRWAAVVETVYGLWTVVTGRQFGRYSHSSVPRSASVENFLLAASMWIVAFALRVSDSSRQQRTVVPPRSSQSSQS